MTPSVDTTIQQSQSETVQSRVREGAYDNLFLVNWIANAGSTISPWWSRTRDHQLREFWKTSDHLSGAVYALQSKMTAIPFRIVPKDRSVREYVSQSEEIEDLLNSAAEFGEGWVSVYGKFVEDMLTQDNGAFLEVIGPGDPAGPIVGLPTSVAHLDSHRCTRTGSAEYPVIYQDLDGRDYKLHYSRVMYASQMTSPNATMFGVGFCSVSRCINVSQTLVDILTFKQEKMGSRPHRAILIPQGGLDPKDVQEAFTLAEARMDASNATRYSKVVLAGSASLEQADVKVVELSTLPDGFDEETSIILGMATIALAFGVDARELFPAMTSGATRADALLQHIKQRLKGPGQILQITEQLFNHKFLPRYLRMVFDYQDDAEDRQIAEIKNIRATRRRQDIEGGSITVRIARELMLKDGDLDRSQFERLELQDGRLPDGTSVLALFYSRQPDISEYLNLGIDDPVDINAHLDEVETMLQLIRERQGVINEVIVNARSQTTRWNAYQAFTALLFLEKKYLQGDLSPFSEAGVGLTLEGQVPGLTPRHRTENLLAPNTDEELNTRIPTLQHFDDRIQ